MSLQRNLSRLLATAIAYTCALLGPPATASELSDVAADVQSGAEHPDHAYDSCDEYDDPYDESCDDDDFWVRALLAGVGAASSINPGLEFTAYPYENDHEGYLAELANPAAATHPLSSRFWAEYGRDFDSIDLASSGLLVEGDNRLGFDLTWRTYFEDLGPEGHDDLATGDVNVLFRLFQWDSGAMRVGGGASWLEFDGEVDAGYNFALSADFFPLRTVDHFP